MSKKSITLTKIGNRIKWLLYSAIPFFISKIRVGRKSDSSFLITIKTSHEYNRAVTFYDKEPEMLEWLNSLPTYGLDKFVFWDIGANIGIYSLYTAMRYPDSKIYCFEPEANNFCSLCNNIYINKLSNVYPYQVGMSDKSAFTDLNISVMAAGAGAASVGSAYKFVSSAPLFRQGIYSTSLNDLYVNKLLPTPNFIKIDVDGHERQILNASDKFLKSNDVLAIMIEMEYTSQEDLKSVIDYFETFDFELAKVSEWKDCVGELTVQNFLLTKKKI